VLLTSPKHEHTVSPSFCDMSLRVQLACSRTACTLPLHTSSRPVGRLPRITPTTYCQAGFGSPESSSKASKTAPKVKPRKVNIAKELGREAAPTASTKADEATASWIAVASLNEFEKPIKPVILKTGKAIVLYKVGDAVYCSDANSTAYQYPLTDATILDLPTGPAVEVPLDGTQYDLATGKVLKWCPGDSPVRGVLGMLKSVTKAVDLPVYRTKVSENGRISVSLV
jgi:nitrite reductase/ring-hydroxylating ferredoxin subunit